MINYTLKSEREIFQYCLKNIPLAPINILADLRRYITLNGKNMLFLKDLMIWNNRFYYLHFQMHLVKMWTMNKQCISLSQLRHNSCIWGLRILLWNDFYGLIFCFPCKSGMAAIEILRIFCRLCKRPCSVTYTWLDWVMIKYVMGKCYYNKCK